MLKRYIRHVSIYMVVVLEASSLEEQKKQDTFVKNILSLAVGRRITKTWNIF